MALYLMSGKSCPDGWKQAPQSNCFPQPCSYNVAHISGFQPFELSVRIACPIWEQRNKSGLFFSQGAGTAIGELPPYFMARAARLSGAEPDDEEYQEFEEMLEHAETAQVRTVQNNRINKTQNN